MIILTPQAAPMAVAIFVSAIISRILLTRLVQRPRRLEISSITDKSLFGVGQFLSNPNKNLDEALESMLKTSHLGDSVHPVVASSARDMLNRHLEERTSVLSSTIRFLTLYRDPLIAKVTSSSDFQVKDIIHAKHPMSLYLVIPASDISRTKAFYRLILNQILTRLVAELPSGERDEHRRLLLLLDEFPSFGRLPFFENALSYIAGYGIKATIISQSLSQLYAEYGSKTSILDNCHVRLFHTPNCLETAETISKMLGQKTQSFEQKSFSGRRASLWLGQLSEGEHYTQRALLTSGEVMTMAPDKELIFIGGKAPIRAKKLRYFEEEDFFFRVMPPLNLEADSYPYGPKKRESCWNEMSSCSPEGENLSGGREFEDSEGIKLQINKNTTEGKSEVDSKDTLKNKVPSKSYFLSEGNRRGDNKKKK